MGQELPPIPRETEPERLRRVFGGLPETVKGAARTLAESHPGVRDFVMGDPHVAVRRFVESVSNALRPPQS